MDHRHRNAAADRRINEAVRRPQPAAIRVQEFAGCVLRRLNVPELRRWDRTVQADMAPDVYKRQRYGSVEVLGVMIRMIRSNSFMMETQISMKPEIKPPLDLSLIHI